MASQTLVLTRADVERVLTLDDCIGAVEDAFRAHGEGRARPPGVLGMEVDGGGFHTKAAVLGTDRPYFAAKVNGNFPENPRRHGLPTIQGVVVLCDAGNGTLLALLDSIEITALRTAAATAVAARHLARADVETAVVCGCGTQGRVQLEALARVRCLKRAFAYDISAESAERFARDMTARLGFPVQSVAGLAGLPMPADEPAVWITCTPARRAFLERVHVTPGAFIAAVGADNADKQEIHSDLMAASKVVVDVLDQCAQIGDLHHALAAGVMKRQDVHAELGAVVAGLEPGRESDEEIIVFDSTGTALQDVAAAVVAYRNAVERGIGTLVSLNA